MTDPNFHIETPRLYLSYLLADNDAHCDLLFRLYNAPHFLEALTGQVMPIPTHQVARERIVTRFAADYAKYGYGQYLISLKPPAVEHEHEHETGADADAPFQERLARCKPIGLVSLLHRDIYVGHTVPDVGFSILPEETRKGYTKEAAQAIIEYGRREKGLDVVIGLFHPKNGASRAVFRSLGFEDRGLRKLVEFESEEREIWVTPGAAEDLSVYNL